MATSEDHGRHGDILRRLDRLEADVARIRDTYPTETVMTAQLNTIHSEIGALRREIGQLAGDMDRRITHTNGTLKEFRDAVHGERSTRKNAWLAAGLALLVTIAGAILLAGIGAIGGG